VSGQASAQTLSVLASFNGSNGENPVGGLAINGSTLYGTTLWGGAYSYGTVFALTIPTPTPEPSTFALLGAGAIGLAGRRWRTRRVAKRKAMPTAFDQPAAQDNDPTILPFRSRASERSDLARRAA
jgi:uncharacterized repeat protein (TIGR03803 family)